MNYHRSRKSQQSRKYLSRLKAVAWGGICISWGLMGIVVAKGDAIFSATVDSEDQPDNEATPAASISNDADGAQISSATTLPEVPDVPTYRAVTTRAGNPSPTAQRPRPSISTVPTARVAIPTRPPQPSLSNRSDSHLLTALVEVDARPSSAQPLPETRSELSPQASEVSGAAAAQPSGADSVANRAYPESQRFPQEPANVALPWTVQTSAEPAITVEPAGLSSADSQGGTREHFPFSFQDDKDALAPRKLEIQLFQSWSPAAAFVAQLPEVDAAIAELEETLSVNSPQPDFSPVNRSPENLRSSVHILWANSRESR